MKSKAINLLSLLPHNPVEFYERVADFTDSRVDTLFHARTRYDAVPVEEGFSAIFDHHDFDLQSVWEEDALLEIEEHIRQRQSDLQQNAPFSLSHNGDPRLGRLCYAIARMIKPRNVVETGVCYGVTSAYVLAAMRQNRHGHLYSIDLPPLVSNNADFVGWLVPNELKERWTLNRGTSARLLGALIRDLGTLDLFIHDSLHTFRNMKHEFDSAWPAIRGGGVLISDDIEGNNAFSQLVHSVKPLLSVVMKEKNKDSLLGVAVKRN